MGFQEGNRYFTTCRDLSLAFQKHQSFEGLLLGGWAPGACTWLVTPIYHPLGRGPQPQELGT